MLKATLIIQSNKYEYHSTSGQFKDLDECRQVAYNHANIKGNRLCILFVDGREYYETFIKD